MECIKEVRAVPAEEPYLYDLEVEGTHAFLTENLLLASNCDGDEDALILLMDGLLNFSRRFIPASRGGLMDAPLVLTSRIDPKEVDKEAHNLDCLFRYPLEFYEAAGRYAKPKEVEGLMDTVRSRLGTPGQYEGLGFTHDTSDFNRAPLVSAYKTIENMNDKLKLQLELGRLIRAVDCADVASRIISVHFIPDITGNLKSFSKQKVRCTKCGASYRRIPLAGVCTNRIKGPDGSVNVCGNNLTLTVYEASVKKYLEVTKEVARTYHVSQYTYQRVLLMEEAINSLFENDRVKVMRLDDYM